GRGGPAPDLRPPASRVGSGPASGGPARAGRPARGRWARPPRRCSGLLTRARRPTAVRSRLTAPLAGDGPGTRGVTPCQFPVDPGIGLHPLLRTGGELPANPDGERVPRGGADLGRPALKGERRHPPMMPPVHPPDRRCGLAGGAGWLLTCAVGPVRSTR